MNMKAVKFPEIRGDNGAEALLNFYHDIGWDGNSNLEPTKIKINEEKWKDFCGMNEEFTDKFFFMSKGPSAEKNIPTDRVHIYKGAF